MGNSTKCVVPFIIEQSYILGSEIWFTICIYIYICIWKQYDVPVYVLRGNRNDPHFICGNDEAKNLIWIDRNQRDFPDGWEILYELLVIQNIFFFITKANSTKFWVYIFNQVAENWIYCIFLIFNIYFFFDKYGVFSSHWEIIITTLSVIVAHKFKLDNIYYYFVFQNNL